MSDPRHPEPQQLHTNSSLPISIGDDTHDVYVSVSEHYEVIDPTLPYEQRFRTDHHTLNVTIETEDGKDFRAEIRVTGRELLDIANGFLTAAIAAIDREESAGV